MWSPWPNFCFLYDDCGFHDVGNPLWREDGSVIYLYNCFWTLPEQSLLGRSPAELTTNHTLLSNVSPTSRARSPYLYPTGTGRRSYTPGNWSPFYRLLRLAGLRWRYFNPPPHGQHFNDAHVTYLAAINMSEKAILLNSLVWLRPVSIATTLLHYSYMKVYLFYFFRHIISSLHIL
jgi:hypothetical protein